MIDERQVATGSRTVSELEPVQATIAPSAAGLTSEPEMQRPENADSYARRMMLSHGFDPDESIQNETNVRETLNSITINNDIAAAGGPSGVGDHLSQRDNQKPTSADLLPQKRLKPEQSARNNALVELPLKGNSPAPDLKASASN